MVRAGKNLFDVSCVTVPNVFFSGNNLKCIFNSMIYVTCVAHGLNRICEKFREMFPNVNTLISCARKIFLKAPARVQIYKDIMGCPLPPDVIVTRWGTWLAAATLHHTIKNWKYLHVPEKLLLV